ncbi:MAG TPA: integration host factor subunit beta [Candidatus Ornithospirochaeta avicola]|uniref:Integration host factor subunit beta n=1 Tax=Candidatus Ornithospirochaeta avicola TaxID=2840896 RepID=A0A9D1PSE9_9SPIO|nr:integration host factor subunit beta [Candidatus Ornithospirochaeta avicola]
MEEKLTKAAIIESLHAKFGISRNDIHTIIDELFEEIKDGLKEDRIIELRGFGTFEVKTRKGREKARNPKTGDIVSVNEHGVAIFRPGKELKEFVWDVRAPKN